MTYGHARSLSNSQDTDSIKQALQRSIDYGTSYKWYHTARGKVILLAFFGLTSIIGGVMQSVCLNQSVSILGAYFTFWATTPFFLIQLGIPVFLYWRNGELKGKMIGIKQRDLFLLGFLTFLNGVMILFAIPHIPPVLQAILAPNVITIPIVMIMSFLYLRTRYDMFRIIFATVLMIGVFIALIPVFYEPPQPYEPSKIPVWAWCFIFAFGSVPAAWSSVYEEKLFAEHPVNEAYMTLMLTAWQSFCIFISFPINIIPEFGQATPPNLFPSQWSSIQCLGGITGPNPPNNQGWCEGWAPIRVFILFSFAYCLYQYSQVAVTKYGNATYAQIVSALVTPLSSVAFAIPAFNSPIPVQTFFWQYGLALGVIFIGLIGYTYFDTKAKVAMAKAEVKVGELSASANIQNAIKGMKNDAYGAVA